MKTLKLVLLLVTLSLSAIAMADIDKSTAVSAVSNAWSEYLNAGNTAKLVKLYAKNAVVLPPSSEILSDETAIRDYWDGLRKVGVHKYVIRTINLRIEGNTAYQTAIWEATRNADGNVIAFEGNMSNVLKRQKDGSWKISLQSWN